MKDSKGFGSIRRVVVNETTKECRKCFIVKPLDEFHNDKTNSAGHYKSYYCKSCANESSRSLHKFRMQNDEVYRLYSRNKHKIQAWGMTLEEYESKWKEQESCAICKIKLVGMQQTHLDHNHQNGKIREFLCTNCNRGLGHFQDNPEILGRAITYLSKHNNNDDVIEEGTRYASID